MVEDAAALDLRRRLVDRLKRGGFIRSERVEQAFLAVPRHLFVPPQVSAEEAYRDEVVLLITGVATLSQPSIVALMLEELAAGPGQKTLEVGTASGYNAALLAEVTEDAALVHTIEIEPELVRQARRNLVQAGYAGVRVREGDGTLGWPAAAPFSRIILTAEATDLSTELLDQVGEAGALLTPFAVPGLPALLLRVRRQAGLVTGGFVGVPVAFVPLRGRYGVDTARRGTGGRAGGEAMWAVEHALWVHRASLTLAQRLALGLVAVALAEREELPPEELASAAWTAYAQAGEPDLEDLAVRVVPVREACPGGLAFQRAECAFCLDLPEERNPAGGSESRRQEDLR